MGHRKIYFMSLCWLLSLFAACADSPATAPTACDPNAPGPSLGEEQRATLPPDPSPPSGDAEWAEIARQVPGGWGGLFKQGGTPVIYLVDPTKQSEAVDALFALGVGQPNDIRQAIVLKGRWDFAQLYDWYRYIQLRAGSPNGLVFSDIDEARNRLHCAFENTDTKASFENSLQPLNLPCELVITEVTSSITPL
jgi:hypothetical protein